MIKTLCTLVFFCMLTASPAALTINYMAGIGEPSVLLSNGEPVPAGTPVQLGLLTPSFDPYNQSYETIILNFETIHETTTRSIFGRDGKFAATAYWGDTSISGLKIWIAIGLGQLSSGCSREIPTTVGSILPMTIQSIRLLRSPLQHLLRHLMELGHPMV